MTVEESVAICLIGWMLTERLPLRAMARMRSSLCSFQRNFETGILCLGNNSRVISDCISHISTVSSAAVFINTLARWTDPSFLDADRIDTLLKGKEFVMSTHGDHARWFITEPLVGSSQLHLNCRLLSRVKLKLTTEYTHYTSTMWLFPLHLQRQAMPLGGGLTSHN